MIDAVCRVAAARWSGLAAVTLTKVVATAMELSVPAVLIASDATTCLWRETGDTQTARGIPARGQTGSRQVAGDGFAADSSICSTFIAGSIFA